MSASEWESLCDGCGLCCLVRFEEEDTGDIIPTRVHCKLFDAHACACTDYVNRKAQVPDCVKLTPGNIETLAWMPHSCAYRRIHEGRTLRPGTRWSPATPRASIAPASRCGARRSARPFWPNPRTHSTSPPGISSPNEGGSRGVANSSHNALRDGTRRPI